MSARLTKVAASNFSPVNKAVAIFEDIRIDGTGGCRSLRGELLDNGARRVAGCADVAVPNSAWFGHRQSPARPSLRALRVDDGLLQSSPCRAGEIRAGNASRKSLAAANDHDDLVLYVDALIRVEVL